MTEEPRIFLSAVTKELGSYRDDLARVLRMRGCIVKVQEEFRTTSGTLLEKLHDYILGCHAVICLIGDRYGWEPSPAEATRYAFSFSREDANRGATPRHSYTQWEYIFARRMNKATFVFLPSDEAERDHGHGEDVEPEELNKLQATFVERDVSLDGRDRTYFDSVEQLKDQVGAIDFQRLVHAEFHQVPLNPSNPYVGLRHFEETERDYFFGRDRLVAELLGGSEQSPLLLVLGPSGSGKSSAVRAGVIPAWRERTNKKGRVVVFNPDEDAFEGFYLGLNRAGYSQQEAKAARTPSPKALRELFDQLHRPGEPWLVFIDQFEELFTRTPRREDAREARRTFVASLVDIAADPPEGLRVILAMRDDFFSNLEGHPELCAITDRNFRRVARMDEGELRAVIQQPAAAHGVAFEPGLVGRILGEVEDPRGRLPLPLLEYTLEALWDRDDITDRILHTESYEAIGGVRGALQKRVTGYYEGLDEEGRQSLRRILLRLVEIGETEVPVSRAARKADLATGSDSAVLEQLLSEQKILVAQESTEDGWAGGTVELAHEALITGWDEFGKWVNECREAIALRNRLREDADEFARLCEGKSGVGLRRFRDELWGGSRLERALELRDAGDFEQIGGLSEREHAFLEDSEAEKRREVARLRRRLAILSALTAVAVIAGIVAGLLYFRAEEQKREARVSRSRFLADLARERIKEQRYDDALALAQEAVPPDVPDWPRVPTALNALHLAYQQYRQAPVRPEVALIGHEGTVEGGFFFHEGDQRFLTWSYDGTARAWDVKTGETVYILHHDRAIRGAVLSPDKGTILTWSMDHTARLWDAASGEAIATLAHDDILQGATFDEDGDQILTWACDGTARLWRPDGTSQAKLEHPAESESEKVVYEAQFLPGDERVISRSSARKVVVWHTDTGEMLHAFDHQTGYLEGIYLVKESTHLLTTDGKTATLWNLADGTEVSRIGGEENARTAIANESGTHALYSSGGKTHLWDLEENMRIRSFDFLFFGKPIYLPEPRSDYVFGRTLDNRIRLIQLSTGEVAAEAAISDEITADGYSEETETVFLGTRSGLVVAWKNLFDDEAKPALSAVKAHDDQIDRIHPYNATNYSTKSKKGGVRLWSQADLSLTAKMEHEAELKGVVSSSATELIASYGKDGVARLWSYFPTDRFTTLKGEGNVTQTEWVPGTHKLACSFSDGNLLIWSPETGEVERETRLPFAVKAFSISPDGDRIVAWNGEDQAALWQPSTSSTHLWEGMPVGATEFSPTGNFLLILGKEEGLSLVDVSDSNPLPQKVPADFPIDHVAWASDGSHYLFLSRQEGKGAVFSADSGDSKLMDLPKGTHDAFFLGRSSDRILTWNKIGQVCCYELGKTNGPTQPAMSEDFPIGISGVVGAPGGSMVYIWFRNDEQVIWDTGNGEILSTWKQYDVAFAEFFTGGQGDLRLLTAGKDRSLIIRDGLTGEEQMRIRSDGSVRLIPGRNRIATGEKLRDLSTGDLVADISLLNFTQPTFSDVAEWVAFRSRSAVFAARAHYGEIYTQADISGELDLLKPLSEIEQREAYILSAESGTNAGLRPLDLAVAGNKVDFVGDRSLLESSDEAGELKVLFVINDRREFMIYHDRHLPGDLIRVEWDLTTGRLRFVTQGAVEEFGIAVDPKIEWAYRAQKVCRIRLVIAEMIDGQEPIPKAAGFFPLVVY